MKFFIRLLCNFIVELSRKWERQIHDGNHLRISSCIVICSSNSEWYFDAFITIQNQFKCNLYLHSIIHYYFIASLCSPSPPYTRAMENFCAPLFRQHEIWTFHLFSNVCWYLQKHSSQRNARRFIYNEIY